VVKNQLQFLKVQSYQVVIPRNLAKLFLHAAMFHKLRLAVYAEIFFFCIHEVTVKTGMNLCEFCML